jgi:predicted nucleic acid-binding protein
MEVSRIFIDTGAFVGPALPRDQFHEQSARAWAQLSGLTIRLFSSDAVFQETMGFLHRAGTDFAITDLCITD